MKATNACCIHIDTLAVAEHEMFWRDGEKGVINKDSGWASSLE